MEATYSYGDAVLVKKIPGSYYHKDLLYFEYPIADTLGTKTYFVQRVVGLPGDSLEISNKQVLVNGFVSSEAATLKYNYFVKTKNMKPDSLFRMRYHLTEGGQISDGFDYSYSLTKQQSDSLRKDSLILHVLQKSEKKNMYDETCFPGHPGYKWNMDHFGKIYIPRMNDTLRLDTVNIKLYSNLIQGSEKNSLEVRHDSIFINGQLSQWYQVKKNYFFMLGDNRDNSNDSRIWGFLPENFIIGKVVYTLKKAE
jgi:signal peptidase I